MSYSKNSAWTNYFFSFNYSFHFFLNLLQLYIFFLIVYRHIFKLLHLLWPNSVLILSALLWFHDGPSQMSLFFWTIFVSLPEMYLYSYLSSYWLLKKYFSGTVPYLLLLAASAHWRVDFVVCLGPKWLYKEAVTRVFFSVVCNVLEVDLQRGCWY